MVASYRLIAKMPTIAAMAYKYSIGQPFISPKNELSYAENFLHMTFAVPAEPYRVSPVLSRAMDKFFILHADHEQNASTSTVRLAGSTGANPYACIAAGMASLWGPAHGGANEAVIHMLLEIGTRDKIPEYIKRAKDKKDPFRLMGFGHRVYKNYDPRAKVLKAACHEVLNELNIKDPLLELAMELERIALTDDYFVRRKLYPNVDFYSGIMLKAFGFPTSMFTALFAIGRTAGWIAHWKEMIEDEPILKIGRPRQLYIGKAEREYQDIEKRAKKHVFNWLWDKKGFAGIVLPLLPTTPFLLLAAACYARASTRFYNWLLNHRWFGSYIQNYRSGAGIPVRVKIIALLVLWVTIGFAAVFTVNLLWIRVGLLALAACISIYLLSLPPLRSKSSCTNQEDER
jgi:uncharacterized membrane protein YbaN (DUF454 family)